MSSTPDPLKKDTWDFDRVRRKTDDWRLKKLGQPSSCVQKPVAYRTRRI